MGLRFPKHSVAHARNSRVPRYPSAHREIDLVARLSFLIRLTRWVHKQKPDILQTVFSEANLIGPCIARLAGVPIVLGTRRNLNHPRREDPHRRGLRLQTLSNLLVNQVIANSRAVLERIVESEGIFAGAFALFTTESTSQ